MIKNETRACTKCKKKIFVSLLDEKDELIVTQFIGLKKIAEGKGPITDGKFVCGLCEKPKAKDKPPKLSNAKKKK